MGAQTSVSGRTKADPRFPRDRQVRHPHENGGYSTLSGILAMLINGRASWLRS